MYQPKTVGDIQKMLKDLFADTMEDMLKAELDEELGYQATNLLTVKHNSVGFAFGIVDRIFNGCTRDDLTVTVKMVVTLTELHHRAVLERPLIVKDKLLTIVLR